MLEDSRIFLSLQMKNGLYGCDHGGSGNKQFTTYGPAWSFCVSARYPGIFFQDSEFAEYRGVRKTVFGFGCQSKSKLLAAAMLFKGTTENKKVSVKIGTMAMIEGVLVC